MAKRKVDRRTSAGQSTLVVREPDATADQVWPEAMQAGGSPSSLPISEETLHQYKPTVFPSTRQVMTLVQDEGPFVVSGEEPPSIGADNAWGCGNHLHNACRRSLVDGGYWQLFSLVKSNISRFVDSLPKAEAKSASKFFLIKGEDDLGIVHLWRLLALPVYNPKAQACVVYAPVGRVADGDFFRGDFVPPYTLRMQVCSSRFSTSSCEAFRSIFFETSDELAARMVKSGAKSWSLVPLDTHICTEANSLLYVVVTGHGAAIDLAVTRQKKQPHTLVKQRVCCGNDCRAQTNGLLVTLRLPALGALQIQHQMCYAMQMPYRLLSWKRLVTRMAAASWARASSARVCWRSSVLGLRHWRSTIGLRASSM